MAKGIKVTGGIKLANELPLRRRDNPELSGGRASVITRVLKCGTQRKKRQSDVVVGFEDGRSHEPRNVGSP